MKSILRFVQREEIALIAVRQLLEGHRRRIDERVQEVESFFVHEPRELVHHALVSNGRQIDEGRAVKGLEIATARIKIHMGRHVVCAEGHLVQIRALQLKGRFIGIDGSLFHQKSKRRQLSAFKMERPLSRHLRLGQLQLPFQKDILSKKLKRIKRGGAHEQTLSVGVQPKVCHLRTDQGDSASFGNVVVECGSPVRRVRHKGVVLPFHVRGQEVDGAWAVKSVQIQASSRLSPSQGLHTTGIPAAGVERVNPRL